jgi:myo-inositol-1(or 4)-monophosphatase
MNEYLEYCIPIVQQTGHMLLEKMARNTLVCSKTSTIDLLTEADQHAQAMIINHLRQRFPNHGFLAEESDQPHLAHEYTWVIDPIDGTTNYWHHMPYFCISVALCHHQRPVVGIVSMPTTNELFYAARGQSAFLNGHPLHVSTTSAIHQSLLATGFPYDRTPGSDNNLVEFGRVMPFVQGIRRCGAAALDLAFVAAGRLDGYWEFHVRPWDIMAGILLVEEAGGTVTTVRPTGDMAGAGGILATNGHIHTALHRLILG